MLLVPGVTSPTGVTTTSEYDNRGRVTKDALGSQISLGYTYAKGLLSAVSRTNGSAVQKYNFTYDTYGNLLKLTVGSRTLMSYSYESQNGQLSKQTYGNGDWASYTYDELGRTTKTSTSDGDAYTYVYTGDGQLHSMTDNQGTSATGDDVKYSYRYDGIGRLVGTEQRGPAGQVVGAYQYDESSRVTKFSYSIPGVIDSATESFYYNSSSTDKIPDGALTSMAMFSDSWLTYTYDSLSRLSKRDVGNILSESYGYLAGKGTCTTTPLVQDFAVLKKGTSTKVAGWKYTYNALGNITKATDVMTGDYRAYSYDNQGQLQYATDYASSGTAGKRYKYYYDAAGNLTSWKAQNGAATVDLESHTYTYGNSDWKDLLTAFDGHAYSYDTSGNPLSYYNGKQYTMSWRNGRELDTLTVGGKKTSYQYDGNGLRTKKTNPDGSYTQYYIVDGLTVGERWFSAGGSVITTLRYLYDENRSPVGFGLRNPGDAGWTNFYFAKNLQGDVTAVYRSDASSGSYYGTLVAAYTYDPYGQVLTMVNGEGADVSGNANSYARINPFRYRGYYQDNESGFYYLQSRYYDPEICRFINADSYASTGQGFLGCNMFAYCNNNPVRFSDTRGELALIDDLAIAAGLLIFAVVVIIVYTPPVQEAIHNLADAITDVFVDTIENVEDIVSKTKEASKKKKEKKETRKSDKEASKDKPSWVNERMIDKNLSAQQNATNLLNEKYGPGNWGKGPKSEFNQIVKWINRSGILLKVISYLWATPEER